MHEHLHGRPLDDSGGVCGGGRVLDSDPANRVSSECETGKEVYRSKRAAFCALAEIRNKPWCRRQKKKPVRVYRCPVCGFYHLTSKRGTDAQEAKATTPSK